MPFQLAGQAAWKPSGRAGSEVPADAAVLIRHHERHPWYEGGAPYVVNKPGGCRSEEGVMSDADLKRVVVEFYDDWTSGVIDFDTLVDADIVNHQPDAEPARGRELFRAAVTGVMTAVPDSRWDISDLVAEGDRVAVRLTWRGTYRAERFRGFDIRSPKPFAVEHIHIYRVAQGKLAEHWVVRDDLALLAQLGALDM